MKTETQVWTALVESNPVPDIRVFETDHNTELAYLAALEQRNGEMTETKTKPEEETAHGDRRWLAVAAAVAAAIVIGIVALLTQPEQSDVVETIPTATTLAPVPTTEPSVPTSEPAVATTLASVDLDPAARDAVACELLTLEDVSAAGLTAASGPVPRLAGPQVEEATCSFLDADGVTERLIVRIYPADNYRGGAYPNSEEVDVTFADAAWFDPVIRFFEVQLVDGSILSIDERNAVEAEGLRDALLQLAEIAVANYSAP